MDTDIDIGRGFGNDHQVSCETSPSFRAARRAALRSVIGWVAGMFAIVGVHGVFAGEKASDIIFSTVVAGVGIVPISLYLVRSAMTLRSYYRMHRDRCIHCGYSVRGLERMICPECGKEPTLP